MKSVKSVSRFGGAALPADVQRLSVLLADQLSHIEPGAELFLVGGLVRDLLLAAPLGRRDLDFATSALPPRTERALRAAGGKVYKIGEKFGTIGAIFGDLHVEVTTYRAEAYQAGSRKPEVAFGRDLSDDLARRDFTINAMALDPRAGDIIDPFGGQRDLSSGIVRAVGDPVARFREDPLRLLRA